MHDRWRAGSPSAGTDRHRSTCSGTAIGRPPGHVALLHGFFAQDVVALLDHPG